MPDPPLSCDGARIVLVFLGVDNYVSLLLLVVVVVVIIHDRVLALFRGQGVGSSDVIVSLGPDIASQGIKAFVPVSAAGIVLLIGMPYMMQ
ncbi:hypothetical protein HYQ46_005533 [Verticillium longisporum]|nr:hypothetical protein HYQ46_005533 [Verticillium longisporum]